MKQIKEVLKNDYDFHYSLHIVFNKRYSLKQLNPEYHKEIFDVWDFKDKEVICRTSSLIEAIETIKKKILKDKSKRLIDYERRNH